MNVKTPLPAFSLLALLISLLLGGCGRVAGVSSTPTSINIPVTPSPQPTASFTPLPTATATSVPTDTPAPFPTPHRQATATAKEIARVDAVNKIVSADLEKYGVDPADGHIVWADQKMIKMELTTYMENSDHVLEEAGKLSDFVIQTSITWDTSGALSLCGITFHAQDDLAAGAQNRFLMMRLQFEPLWTIQRWEYEKYQSDLQGGWMPSFDIHDENGSSNVVALVVRGKDIDIFINRDKQRRVENSKLTEGLLALSAHQESGRTVCEFENSWVWAFDN